MAVSDQPEPVPALAPIAAGVVDALVSTGPPLTALVHIFLTLMASPAQGTGTLVGFITGATVQAGLYARSLITIVRMKPFPAWTAFWIEM